MLRILLITAAVTILPAQPVNKAPKDFALRMAFGCAGTDVIDTRAGTYVRHMSLRRPQVADVFISSKLKDQLFTLVNDARFFETQSLVGMAVCEPSTDYHLQVTSDGKTHSVRWADCHLPEMDGEDGKRMRTLTEEILKPFQKMGAVKQLRKQDLVCL